MASFWDDWLQIQKILLGLKYYQTVSHSKKSFVKKTDAASFIIVWRSINNQ